MRNTSLCYIENNGKYLMLHRVKKAVDENKDKWIGIGGKFEEGESPEDCTLREVFEETGLRLNHLHFRGIVTFVSDEWGTEYMHLFTSSVSAEEAASILSGGRMPECDEGTLEWVDIQKIPELPIWEGDRIFLGLLRRDAPYFRLRLEYRGESLKRAILNGEDIKL